MEGREERHKVYGEGGENNHAKKREQGAKRGWREQVEKEGRREATGRKGK